jgi:hypothetical protein
LRNVHFHIATTAEYDEKSELRLDDAKPKLGQVIKLWFRRCGVNPKYLIKIACLVRTWQINFFPSTTSFLLPLTYTEIIST